MSDLFFVFLFIILSSHSETVVPPTESAKIIPSDQRQISTPFAACNDPVVKKKAMKPFWRSDLPMGDGFDNTSKDFLQQLLERASVINMKNQIVAKNLKYCMTIGKSNPSCKVFHSWIGSFRQSKATLPLGSRRMSHRQNNHKETKLSRPLPSIDEGTTLFELAHSARFFLAVGEAEHSKLWGTFRIKKNPTSSRLSRPTPWQELSPNELKKAQQELDDIVKDTKAAVEAGETPCRPKDHVCFAYEVHKALDLYKDDYERSIERNPMLKFISSPDPKPPELARAADIILSSANKEQQILNNLKNSLSSFKTVLMDKPFRSKYAYGDIFRNYPDLVEGLLSAKPEYCGVASLLKNKIDQNNMFSTVTENTLVIGGSLALSVFASPWAGAALYAGGSGYWFQKRFAQRDFATNRDFSDTLIGAGPSGRKVKEIEQDMISEAKWLAGFAAGGGAFKGLKLLRGLKSP